MPTTKINENIPDLLDSRLTNVRKKLSHYEKKASELRDEEYRLSQLKKGQLKLQGIDTKQYSIFEDLEEVTKNG